MMVAAIKLYENSKSDQKDKPTSLGKRKPIKYRASVLKLSLKIINQNKHFSKQKQPRTQNKFYISYTSIQSVKAQEKKVFQYAFYKKK